MSDNEKIYNDAVAELSSSLTSFETKRKAIERLQTLGDFKGGDLVAEEYERLLCLAEKEQEERDKKRKTSRRMQMFFTVIGMILSVAVIVIVALCVREAF